VAKNASRPKNRISGNARTSSVSDAASWENNRAVAQRTIENRPTPITSQTSPTSTRLATMVAAALPSWPPNTTGSSGGSTTKAVSSGTPMLWGTALNGRPRNRLNRPNRASSSAAPPTMAARFCHQCQSSLAAPSTSSRATSSRKGRARVKMSSLAE
jgi:hypothetical protein